MKTCWKHFKYHDYTRGLDRQRETSMVSPSCTTTPTQLCCPLVLDGRSNVTYHGFNVKVLPPVVSTINCKGNASRVCQIVDLSSRDTPVPAPVLYELWLNLGQRRPTQILVILPLLL